MQLVDPGPRDYDPIRHYLPMPKFLLYVVAVHKIGHPLSDSLPRFAYFFSVLLPGPGTHAAFPLLLRVNLCRRLLLQRCLGWHNFANGRFHGRNRKIGLITRAFHVPIINSWKCSRPEGFSFQSPVAVLLSQPFQIASSFTIPL